MCQECGCGLPREVSIHGPASGGMTSPVPQPSHVSERDSASATAAAAPHAHDAADHQHAPRTLDLNRSLLEKNDRLAERNRGYFRAKRLLVLNVLSAPGSGKTTFIQKTAELLAGQCRLGVIVGDLATDNDANRLRAAGLPVVQITTGTVCHLDAEMVARAANQLELDSLDLLIIENVGNLVCPAAYDLGEDLRVVLLSVTEGEDKPLKYPPLFHSANVAIVTKADLATVTGWNRDLALANLRRASHHAAVFELSARSGDGMEAWRRFLLQARDALTAGQR
jgi:hydrogenase nickel incorporation protein HypB